MIILRFPEPQVEQYRPATKLVYGFLPQAGLRLRPTSFQLSHTVRLRDASRQSGLPLSKSTPIAATEDRTTTDSGVSKLFCRHWFFIARQFRQPVSAAGITKCFSSGGERDGACRLRNIRAGRLSQRLQLHIYETSKSHRDCVEMLKS